MNKADCGQIVNAKKLSVYSTHCRKFGSPVDFAQNKIATLWDISRQRNLVNYTANSAGVYMLKLCVLWPRNVTSVSGDSEH